MNAAAHHPLALLASVLALSVGTYAFRLAGPLLRTRMNVPKSVQRILETAAIVLLTALIATTALTEGHGPAGPARPLGVAIAGILAWRKAPFLLVVLGAAAATAVLRLAGLS